MRPPDIQGATALLRPSTLAAGMALAKDSQAFLECFWEVSVCQPAPPLILDEASTAQNHCLTADSSCNTQMALLELLLERTRADGLESDSYSHVLQLIQRPSLNQYNPPEVGQLCTKGTLSACLCNLHAKSGRGRPLKPTMHFRSVIVPFKR